jgi:hypothetical protein
MEFDTKITKEGFNPYQSSIGLSSIVACFLALQTKFDPINIVKPRSSRQSVQSTSGKIT